MVKTADTDFIRALVDEVVKEFPLKIEQYQNGKSGIINMLMGEIKRRSRDKFEATTANELLMKKLSTLMNR
ncbi:MAG: hypothetical protein JST48_09160 [Bacteroidetes bacterium]|nr:hypothetical protein [Bacteroidota bacterium]